MTVVSDGSFEKIVLFGGIQNTIKSTSQIDKVANDENSIKPSLVTSFLTNKTYII
jgi:hypothetical protein